MSCDEHSICQGNYDIEQFGGSVSREAKDLISKLLVVKSGDRISAKKALKHQWYVKYFLDNKVEKNSLNGFSSIRIFER